MQFKCLILFMLVPVAGFAFTDPAALEPHSGKLVVDLTISGNNVTKYYVIRREIHTAEGDTLSLETIKKDIERLKNLGIFADITILPTQYSNGVGLEFEFREMPWIFPYVAFRYTEENGWSVGPALTSVNLFGRAISVSGRWLFGGTNTFDLLFNWPWLTGNHISLKLSASHLVRDQVVLDFEEDSWEVSPWVGTWIGETGRLEGTLSWFQMKADKPNRTLDPDNQDNILRLGGRIGYDNRDSWRNPHRGWWHEIQVMKAGGRLSGNGDFWAVDFDLQRYQPITRRQTLILGWLTTLQSGQVGVDVPSYLQYFMGGANSIRGYEFDVLGKDLFGKNQMIVTVEYQYLVTAIRPIPIWKWAIAAGLEVAAFTDTGIAWETSPELDVNDAFAWDRFKTGVGIGLRFLVPSVDVIRADFAVGEDGNFQFHFAVWPKLYAQRLRVR